MDLTNLRTAKLQILKTIQKQAKDNLNKPESRTQISAKWEKKGKDWKPLSVSKRTVKRKISNTGRLSASIKYKVIGNKLTVETLSYGRYIDLGRKKGEEPPHSDIQKWARQKGIKDATFQIQRKLKFFGMAPTYFLTNPVKEILPKVGELLATAYAKDLDNAFENNN